MFTNQKEALKKVFSLYKEFKYEQDREDYIAQSIVFARWDVINAIPELIQAFPSIALLEIKDDSDILKNIVMEKYKKEKGGNLNE